MSEDILKRIVAQKHLEVQQAQKSVPLAELRVKAGDGIIFRPFLKTLLESGSDTNIIAEIKRASPSKGVIGGPELDPAHFACAYEEGGACAISVLTDQDFFMGSSDDFAMARKSCTLPMLRKDFIVSEYQVYESAVMGADCILLIARILSQEELSRYYKLARDLGMDVLLEVFDHKDLVSAKKTGAELIGINNRNLASFHTDRGHAATISGFLDKDQIPVAASGISTREDIILNQRAGIKHFLIGESLVRSENPVEFIKTLKGEAL